MKHAFIVALGSASIVASADAGLAGLVAFSRNMGSRTVIDVFVAVTNPNDRFLAVEGAASSATFLQRAGMSSKTWRPDVEGMGSTRNTADDSFMTAGTLQGGLVAGNHHASATTERQQSFSSSAADWWVATQSSSPAVTLPMDPETGLGSAAWLSNDPLSVDNRPELMSRWAGRFGRTDSRRVGAGPAVPAASNGFGYGIWVSHLVLGSRNQRIGIDFSFRATALVMDASSGQVTQAEYEFPAAPVPTPGACALLGAAAVTGGTKRRRG
jgi:hypothetical protein